MSKKKELNSALNKYLKQKGLSKDERKECIDILHNVIKQYKEMIKTVEDAENELEIETTEEDMEVVFCCGCRYMTYDQAAGFTAEPTFHCQLHNLQTSPLGLCSWGSPVEDEEEEIPFQKQENIIADISLNHCCAKNYDWW